MSAEQVGVTASSRRASRTVIARLTVRNAGRSGALWGLVFGTYVVASSLGYASAYTTPRARAQVAASFGSNLGFNAIIGPAHHLDTVAGFTAWRSLGVLSIVGAVWSLLAGTRLLRGEEEAGRWELLLAGHTTRRWAAAQAVAGLAVGVLVLWLVTALITITVGRSSEVNFSVLSSMFLAAAMASSAAIFSSVGALTSQLAPTRRQAAGYAAGALAVSYALRMIADSGTGLEWLRWASPLGWVEELRPLSAERPLMLVPVIGLSAGLAALAVHLAGQRDLGASTIADQSTARARIRLLSGPTLLALRLTRPVLIAWATAICLLGLMMGFISKSVGTALSENAVFQQALARLGGRGAGASAYLAVTFLVVALLLSLITIGQLGAARDEEAEGRLDHLLVRPVARTRWLIGRLGIAMIVLVLGGLLAGLATWVGAATQDAGVGLGPLLYAGLNLVPTTVFVLGIGTLTFGVRPRATVMVPYGVLAWSFLVEIIGGTINANHWILDTSLFHHQAAAPATSPNWTSGAALAALGLAAAVPGVLAFRRRDLAGR